MLVIKQKRDAVVNIYLNGQKIGEIRNAGPSTTSIGYSLPKEYKILRSKLTPKT